MLIRLPTRSNNPLPYPFSHSFWSREYFELIATDAKSAMNQSKFDVNTCNGPQTRENGCDQVTISFWFCFALIEKVALEFCKPITKRSDATSRQTRNYFRHLIENRSKLNNKYFSRIFMNDDGLPINMY